MTDSEEREFADVELRGEWNLKDYALAAGFEGKRSHSVVKVDKIVDAAIVPEHNKIK